MIILSFTDIHAQGEDVEIIRKKAKKADLVICCGDFTVFTHDLNNMIKFMDGLGKKVLLIHGNHEDSGEIAKLCEKSKNLIFIHKKQVEIDGINFIGFGGGGFTYTNPGFDEWNKKLNLKGKKVVFVTHQPPHNTKLDFLEWCGHVGSKTFKKFIDTAQPKLALSGHIHETFNVRDKVKKTVLLNPGPDGTYINI